MSETCVTFDKMSDLYDNEVSIEEEKEEILIHFDECPGCKTEYGRLRNTIKLVSYLKCQKIKLEKFPDITIRSIKNQKRKKTFVKYMPAIAAALVFSVGAGIVLNGFNIGNISFVTKKKRIDLNPTNIKSGDLERAVKIVSDYKAKVLKVSEQYVEGEIDIKKFRTLYRALGHNGFHKLRYGIVSDSGEINISRNTWTGSNMKNNFENIGSGNIILPDKISDNKKLKFVKFRIYK